MTDKTFKPAGEAGTGASRAHGEPPLSPKQFSQKYGVGLTRVYEECRSGVLKDACRHWGRRILIPASAAARLFDEEV